MKNTLFWLWFNEGPRKQLGSRAETFAKMFEHLDALDRPVTIIETGCARRDQTDMESWKGDGCSTVLFDVYVETRRCLGDQLFSVDIDPAAVRACERQTKFALIENQDSIQFLKGIGQHFPDGVDLLYLDSFDFSPADPLPAAIHHHAELMAAMPMIRPHTLVVVDDAWATMDDSTRLEVGGKGFMVARHMLLCGADLKFCAYQSGWTGVGAVRKDRGGQDIKSLVERARAHVEADRAVPAEHLYRLILAMTSPPTTGQSRVAHGEACAFYAKLSLAKGRLGAAADWFREALKADPLGTDYRLDAVERCFVPMGHLTEALRYAETATKLAPDYPRAWHILGGVRHELHDPAKAIEAHEEQIRLAPADMDGYLDRASVAIDVADYVTAREMAMTAIESDRRGDALHVLGMCAYREARHEEAIELYDAAIKAKGRDIPVIRFNKSLALHAIGRYREGWVEHECREHQRSNPSLWLPMKRFTLPRWTGQPPLIPVGIAGTETGELGRQALIHVHAEAGAGDNFACQRWLRVMRDQGYRVRYECGEEMVDLMRTSFPDIEIVPKAPDYPGALTIKPFDYHAPIGSLPAIYEADIDTIPWSGPYIAADPIIADRYRAKLNGQRAVGLCWSSGIRDGLWMTEFGMRKSMHFDATFNLALEAIALGFKVVSLQVGPERAQHNGALTELLP